MECYFCHEQLQLKSHIKYDTCAAVLQDHELHELTYEKSDFECQKCNQIYSLYHDNFCWCGKIHNEIGNIKKEWYEKVDGEWKIKGIV